MYKIAVPVTNENVTRCTPEKVYAEIKKFNPHRIFISVGEYELDPVKRETALSELRMNCEFFKSKGYEVGVWIWAFMLKNSPFTCMKSLKGVDHPESIYRLSGERLPAEIGGHPALYMQCKKRESGLAV